MATFEFTDGVSVDVSGAVEATWAGSLSNSYVTWTAANSCIVAGIVANSAWTAASQTQQSAALIEATRDIDSRNYISKPKYTYQALKFPRDLLLDGSSSGDSESDELTTWESQEQAAVQRATSHQAVWILRNAGKNQHLEAISLGIRRSDKQVGPVREAYDYSARGNRLCPEAVAILTPYFDSRKILRG
jgi:hypothetical protein